ncbi:MAG: SDR family oxidoreductase [Alphaproteobacteria bacterium]|nr:SDR family oxidoreductase [Alphaproteobacteria bacterium]
MPSPIALVTGAARGIGEAVARRLHADGAVVWCTDLRDAEVDAVARSLGARARARHLDVREEGDWQAVMDELLATDGRLDVLVNNAGITGFDPPVPHDPEHASLADWQAVLRTNLDGTFLGCRAALRAMRRTGTGSIVNIGSRSGAVGVPGAAAYAASKAAIANHTRSVALYAAQQGWSVRCNAIQPAAVRTPMWDPMFAGADDPVALEATFVADIPLRRFADPAEVAALVAFLASAESGYLTGAVLDLDGGQRAGLATPPAPSSD